jgi:hypothetical protein
MSPAGRGGITDDTVRDHGQYRGVLAMVEEHHVLYQQQPGRPRLRHQALGQRVVGHERLLAQDVLARGQCRLDPLGMQAGRQRDVHGVDVVPVQQRLVARDRDEPELVAEVFRLGRVPARHRHRHGTRRGEQCGQHPPPRYRGRTEDTEPQHHRTSHSPSPRGHSTDGT